MVERNRPVNIRIGMLVERQRAYGRRFCEGAAAYALETPGISLGMLEWGDLSRPRVLASFDVLVVRVLDDEDERQLRKANRPVVDVFYGREREGFGVVDLDNAAIARLAADHLLSHGFINFAYCGYEGVRFSDARRAAFVAFVRKAGFDCSVYATPERVIRRFGDHVVRGEHYALTSAEEYAMGRWMAALPKPVAVFCSHDLRAHQLLDVCLKCGVEVPREVAILGVDDDALLCGFTTPTLSSIDPNGWQAGRNAIRMAVEMAADRPLRKGFHGHFTKPKGLVVRGSTEIYPVVPAWLSDALVFIRKNAVKGIGPNEVFAYLGRSHTAVGRVFRAKLGTTVLQEISRARLEEACRLLRETGLSVQEVAHAAGFSTAQYFCRAFSDAYGMSAGAWRAHYGCRGGMFPKR